MAGRRLILSLVLATTAQAQMFSSTSSQGDVAVNVGSADHLDVGVRYWISDGVSVGVSWDASAFADVNSGFPVTQVADLEVDAQTVALSMETDWIVLGNRFTYANGVQVFGQRQVNDVVVGYNTDFDAVVRPDGREIQVLGIGLTNRYDLRLAGPVYVGFQGGLFGLRLVRTEGGTAVRNGVTVDLEDETSTRLKFGGPARFYFAVRL